MKFRIHIYGFLETPEKRTEAVQSRRVLRTASHTRRWTEDVQDVPRTRPLG